MTGFFAFLTSAGVALLVAIATDDNHITDKRSFVIYVSFATVFSFCAFLDSAADKIIKAMKQEHAPTEEKKPVADQKS